jgi:hypothetical protein
MLRTAAKKVAWVGRTASMVLGLALVLALVLGVATMALGATGGNFILGKGNSAGATSKLTSAVAGPTLNLINNGTAAAATALNLTVPSGKPPLRVNSSTKVDNFNADLLDSKHAADFLGANQKAADSDKLDGIDSTDFVQWNSTSFVHGNGTAYQGAVDVPPGATSNLILDIQDPQIGLQYACPNDVTTNGWVYVLNRTFQSPQTVRLFSDNGSTDPSYQSLDSGQVHSEAAAANGEHLTFRVQASGPKLVTIEVFSVHDPAGRVFPGDCHVDVQAFVTR